MGTETIPERPAEPPRDAEVIVIGSGFGGAVSACRLAQVGFDVLILERGRRYEAKDFPSLPVPDALLPDLRRWTWSGEQGLWDVVDLQELISVQAAGYGGGSLIYANVHLRPPQSVFDERWPEIYRKPDALKEYYDLAAYMLQARPITEHPELGKKLVKAEQLSRAADKLGRGAQFFYPPLAVSYEAKAPGQEPEPPRAPAACTGCGSCVTGCPERAKNTLDFNYLAIAESEGATVRTECEVREIVQRTDGSWEVHALDHLQAKTRCFTSRYVFVCAGSLHSTRLLARTRLVDRKVQRRLRSLLGVGYSPGGDALGVAFHTDNAQYPSVGPTITTTTVHWDTPESFFQIQDGGYAPELARLIGMFTASAWVGRNRLSRKADGFQKAMRVASSSGQAKALAGVRQDLQSVPRDQVLPSPVDAILDALSAGNLSDVASKQLKEMVPQFIDELGGPLLMPAIVNRTVDGALSSTWLIRTLPEPFKKPTKWLIRQLIRILLATDEDFGRRAFKALVTGSSLGRHQLASGVLGYDAAGAANRTMLLAMGRDTAHGTLQYDRTADRLIADLDLSALAPQYVQEERLMTDIARALGGELRTNPAWEFLGKPITVHNQGGCPMSDDPKHGVTDKDGMVHDADGLYVADGSLFCTPVGVNPSATIAAIAERNVHEFIEKHAPAKGRSAAGMRGYVKHTEAAAEWAVSTKWHVTPPPGPSPDFQSATLGIEFHESMQGFYTTEGVDSTLGNRLRDDPEYRRYETVGRRTLTSIETLLSVKTTNLKVFFEDPAHTLEIGGTVKMTWLDGLPIETQVEGILELFVPRFKGYGIRQSDKLRLEAHARLIKRPNAPPQRFIPRCGRRRGDAYPTRVGRPVEQKQRFMTYHLRLVDKPGYWLIGYKRIRNDPGFDAWRDTTTLFTRLVHVDDAKHEKIVGAGAIHVDLPRFAFGLLPSIEITGTKDPARITWATAKFAAFFFGELQRIYSPGTALTVEALFGSHRTHAPRWPRRRQ